MTAAGENISKKLKDMGYTEAASRVNNTSAAASKNIGAIASVFASAIASKNQKTPKSYTFLDGVNHVKGSQNW